MAPLLPQLHLARGHGGALENRAGVLEAKVYGQAERGDIITDFQMSQAAGAVAVTCSCSGGDRDGIDAVETETPDPESPVCIILNFLTATACSMLLPRKTCDFQIT